MVDDPTAPPSSSPSSSADETVSLASANAEALAREPPAEAPVATANDGDRDSKGGGKPCEHSEKRPPNGARSRQVRISVALFVLTFMSAMWSQVGSRASEEVLDFLLIPLHEPQRLLEGMPFAVALMGILLAHEMGHFLTAHRYGVDQSPPYFIPAPTLFGTLGAVILMRSQPKNRRVLLHVAVMGPYAGLLLAVPAAAWGLQHSVPLLAGEPVGGQYWLGSSLLFHWLENWFSPNGSDVTLHPVALAGWVGMFVTSLNLIPAAQLDGGHIAYALFGKRQERLSLVVVVLLLGFGLSSYMLARPGSDEPAGSEMWIFWALLLFVVGIGHPPVEKEHVRLTRLDKVSGVVALVVFALTFIPYPVKLLAPGSEINGATIDRSFAQEPYGDEDFPPQADELGRPAGAAEEFRL